MVAARRGRRTADSGGDQYDEGAPREQAVGVGEEVRELARHRRWQERGEAARRDHGERGHEGRLGEEDPAGDFGVALVEARVQDGEEAEISEDEHPEAQARQRLVPQRVRRDWRRRCAKLYKRRDQTDKTPTRKRTDTDERTEASDESLAARATAVRDAMAKAARVRARGWAHAPASRRRTRPQ